MLETIMDSYVILGAMGAVAAVGIISKLVTVLTLRRLVRASGRMGKSSHKLMKLVKAKFEHTVMLSDRVENIPVFVEKYIHEYKALGMRLHGWRHLGKQTIWISGALGITGAALSYGLGRTQEETFQYLALSGVVVAVLYLLRVFTDESYQLKAVQMYMVDYLENICAPRYQKQQTLQMHRMGQIVNEPEIMPARGAETEGRKEEPLMEQSVTAEAAGAQNVTGEPITEQSIAESMAEPIAEQSMAEPTAEQSVMESIAEESVFGELKEEMKPESETEKRVPQEVILREILEEFLA